LPLKSQLCLTAGSQLVLGKLWRFSRKKIPAGLDFFAYFLG